MEKETTKGLRIFAVGFVIFLLLVFAAICMRFTVRQIIIKRMEITNKFTDLIFFDAKDLNTIPDAAPEENKINQINWQELYPFKNSDGTVVTEEKSEGNKTDPTRIEKFEQTVKKIEKDIASYPTRHLPFYRKITEMAVEYEKIIQWDFAPPSEYNNVTTLSGGYLVGIVSKVDVAEIAKATIELAKFCEEHNAKFVYIQTPSKICAYKDKDISGTIDFSNQNVDDFLTKLKSAGVTTYDHRADIHSEGLNHHSMFFNTDHHWTGQSGLWAAQHVLAFLNKQYGYNFNEKLLDKSNYKEVVYKDWFLGSQGKKVTLSVAKPDDIALLYPQYETRIHYEIPSMGIDEHCSLDITYLMECIKEKDYYKQNPYGAYNHADQPLIRIENELIKEGPRVLIIHDSFYNCVIPFAAMGIKYIDSIDLRYFNGSLISFIEQTKPDVVIVAYNPVAIGSQVDYSTHSDLFDFR